MALQAARQHSFTIIGVPAPQGSKTPWGSEANPNTKPWRATVAAEAAFHRDQITGDSLAAGPLKVTARFYFPRPKSHYRTGKRANELKDNAPTFCATKPDLDKLQRAIGDALTGVLIRDDNQIVHWVALKLYGAPARCELTIEPTYALIVAPGRGRHDETKETT